MTSLRLRAVLADVRASLWFVPLLLVSSGVALAAALIALDSLVGDDALARFPHLFGVAADGSRQMLATIATATVSLAGVTFSLTLVVLTLAASQYTPRLVRSFMKSRPTQVVLGLFVAVYMYALVVMRTIRADDPEFVPSLAVFGGVVLALVGVGALVFFIHHTASSIQPSLILARVRAETEAAIDRLFPEELGERGDEARADDASELAEPATPVASPATGYLQSVDGDELLRFAVERDLVVRMCCGVGDFIVAGRPLVTLAHRPGAAGATTLSAGERRRIERIFVVGAFRTVDQDAAFGIRQIVDVALRALSPGVRDDTTAVACVHQLTAILVRLARRRIASPYRSADGIVRVIATGDDFDGLLRLACAEIRSSGAATPTVAVALGEALATVATVTGDGRRREAVFQQLVVLAEEARTRIDSAHDRAAVVAQLADCIERARVPDRAPGDAR